MDWLAVQFCWYKIGNTAAISELPKFGETFGRTDLDRVKPT
jgi:hypothetical protein